MMKFLLAGLVVGAMAALPSVHATGANKWRLLTPTVTSIPSWVVAEVEFYSSSDCSDASFIPPIPGGEIESDHFQSPDPDFSPDNAFDGNYSDTFGLEHRMGMATSGLVWTLVSLLSRSVV